MRRRLCSFSSTSRGACTPPSLLQQPRVPHATRLYKHAEVLRGRYVFNAGEGFQRFCVQHQIKLNRISDLLLTRLSTDACGGLPGG